jgi:hypothetical protein
VLDDAPTAFWRAGPSGRGSAGDTVALAAPGAACTVEAWIRAGQGGGVAAVGLRDAAAGGLSLGIDSTGAARAEDAWPLVGAMPVADGRWHHLVYTRDGAIGRLYVDGLLDAEALLPPPAGSGPLVVGYDPVSGVRFQGDVDGVAVYAHPLGAARVRAHYLASGRRPVPGPIVDDPTAGPGPFLRARLLGAAEASLPFSLRAPAEPRVTAFGG